MSPSNTINNDTSEWYCTTSLRKRFKEKNEKPIKPPKKKRKIKAEVNDDLSNSLWDDKYSIKKIDSNEELETYDNIKDEEDCEIITKIDLHNESKEIQKILIDYSKIVIPSKEEINERKEERMKRIKNIKYDTVVRKRTERESMPGHACEMCKKFYDALDDETFDKSEFILNCSKHRYNYSPPPTPPGYWELDFFDENDIEELKPNKSKQDDIVIID